MKKSPPRFSILFSSLILFAVCAAHRPMTGNSPHQSIRDSVPPSKGQALKNPALLQGIWVAEGEDNATFVIKGSKITYPDSQRSYAFTLSKDTLILIGDETQRFYRFKK